MKYKHYLLFLLLTCVTIANGQVVFSSMPLDGINGSSFFIVNHMDHDTSSALLDFACGDKTYNGHTGTDFVIRSFKTMDSGVNVRAVASGRVIFVSDTQYDRNKRINALGFGNYIAINHQNQIYTYYAHIKKNSAVVRLGDSVTAGQVLAKVGCSGNCTDPHVHLEVYDYYSTLIDPFSGSCQRATTSLWRTQPTYDTALKVIDQGFTAYVPNLDTLRERYAIKDTFRYGIDDTVTFWVQSQGVRRGDTERFEWFSPAGSLWYSYSAASSQNWWYYYNWNYIYTPDTAGFWTAKYYVNNNLVTSKRFFVVRPTGIANTAIQENRPLLFPNPTTGTLYIGGNLPNGYPIVVTDMVGKELLRVPQPCRELSLATLPTGCYLFRCGTFVAKVYRE